MSETLDVLPNELPDDLRRQLFWVIKRHTSYTAWARAFDAFDALICKMDSLRPELAAGSPGIYGVGLPPHTTPISQWPEWWYALKCHRTYHTALTRLRRGDKRVLGENGSVAVLVFADSYCEHLLRFFRGEHPRDGYYRELDPIIPEKAALTRLAWQAYTFAKENIILSNTTRGGGPYSIDIDQIYSPDTRSLKTLLPDSLGSPDFSFGDGFYDILSRYPIPADPPPVPDPVILPMPKVPWGDPAFRHGGPLIIKSDRRVSLPGIYLSDPHGAICYLPAGTRAPFLDAGSQEADLPCTWTLIWRDDRYENGADIPEEEALYFPEG